MTGFPLSAIVGADDLRLALVLAAVEHRIGGVLLRGEKGSAKTTAARALAGLVPGSAPFVELPLGATEDRLVGSFDVRAALGTGEYRYRPGLLEAADGGVLYVDEVNLLADHLVDLLLDAAATGVVHVERDGISETRSARFVLVGSMNPEEGELRPQLLDRFGLSVEVAAPADPVSRAEAVRRRVAYDRDPDALRSAWEDAERALARRLATARPAELPDALYEQVASLCTAAGAEGLRADLVICRAAAALAGWEGREVATFDDVRRVAPFALAHRRRGPWEPLEPLLAPPADGGREPQTPPDAGVGRSGEAGETGEVGEVEGVGSGSGGAAPGQADGGREEQVGGAAPGQAGGGREEPQAPTLSGSPLGAPPAPASGRRRLGTAVEAPRGRLLGSRAPAADRGPVSLHATGTVLAAAARHDGSGPLRVEEEDLREPVRHQVPGTLVVMVVDASGSMGVRRRLEAARGAVLALLVDAYQRRDRVALVVFRGERAETLLRPTGSTEIARARLVGMPTGGRTPLASGIREGLALATARRHSADRPLLVVVSDGRATFAEGGADPVAASLAAAAEVKAAGVDALVVDCEAGGRRLGLAHGLARAMGARRVAVGDLTGEALAGAVRGALV